MSKPAPPRFAEAAFLLTGGARPAMIHLMSSVTVTAEISESLSDVADIVVVLTISLGVHSLMSDLVHFHKGRDKRVRAAAFCRAVSHEVADLGGSILHIHSAFVEHVNQVAKLDIASTLVRALKHAETSAADSE